MAQKQPQQFYFNPGGDQSKVEKASLTEMAVIQEKRADLARWRSIRDSAASKVKELEAACTHKFFYDEAGFIYDTRICALCGKSTGFI